jgi:4-oxalocrotonate tautomerase
MKSERHSIFFPLPNRHLQQQWIHLFITLKHLTMPFVNVKLVEGVFSTEEKHQLAAALTDVLVKFEGSEAFRETVWVLIEELHPDGWHIGGRAWAGPQSLEETLIRQKSIVEKLKGHPTTRKEWAEAAPVKQVV